MYITRLASNEILSPSNKIHREIGRAKDLSAPSVSLIQFFALGQQRIYITLCGRMYGPGQLSRYSDSLRAWRSGDRIPVGAKFSAPVQTGSGGPPSFLYNGYRVSFPEVKWSRRDLDHPPDGFGDLVVSILATGTRVCGFKSGRSRWIFRASGKSSVCFPLEGK